MGGNGSFLSGITNFENGRMYKTVSSIGDNIKVLETKNPKAGVKLPEESHTPNRTYATFYRNGKGLKEIARYGPDGKKIEEIQKSLSRLFTTRDAMLFLGSVQHSFGVSTP
jgi:hypothetical protein